jgi:hypothetical protein
MSMKNLADPESIGKPVRPGRAAGLKRAPSTLARFAALAAGGPVLMMTARFGRSPVRDAAYRLRERRPDLHLKLSWRLFASLEDWGKRWPAEQDTFAAGLILSAADDPAVERAVGRCLADLARLGRPLLWGTIGQPVRWHPRFMISPNGWPPERILPPPAAYARLGVAHDAAEFRPRFDPILFSADPDFFIFESRLCWFEPRHFQRAAPHG